MEKNINCEIINRSNTKFSKITPYELYGSQFRRVFNETLGMKELSVYLPLYTCRGRRILSFASSWELPFRVTAWFWFFSGDTKEVDNKKEKECDIIDLTLDSDSESEKDTNDNDDDQESDNDRDLNTPRYIVCFSASHVGCIHFCQ